MCRAHANYCNVRPFAWSSIAEVMISGTALTSRCGQGVEPSINSHGVWYCAPGCRCCFPPFQDDGGIVMLPGAPAPSRRSIRALLLLLLNSRPTRARVRSTSGRQTSQSAARCWPRRCRWAFRRTFLERELGRLVVLHHRSRWRGFLHQLSGEAATATAGCRLLLQLPSFFFNGGEIGYVLRSPRGLDAWRSRSFAECQSPFFSAARKPGEGSASFGSSAAIEQQLSRGWALGAFARRDVRWSSEGLHQLRPTIEKLRPRSIAV